MSDTSVDRVIKKALERAALQPQGQCPDQNRLAAYLESRCAAPERLQLQEHFAGCETCRQVLALSLGLSESESGKAVQYRPARGRFLRFAIPASALAAAAVLFGIVVVWQKQTTQTGKRTAELRSVSSAPAPPVSQPSPAVSQDRKEPVQRASAGATARQAELPAGTARRAESPAVAAPPAADRLAEVQERSLPSAASAAKPEPFATAQVAETSKAAEAKSELQPKQVQNERVAFKAESPAQNQPMQLQQRAQAPAQTRLTQAQQMALAAGALTSDRAQSFVEQPQDAIAEFSSAGVAGRNTTPVRKAGGKVFYQWSGYWIDGECTAHAKAPLVEAGRGSEGYKEVIEQFPALLDLDTTTGTVLLYCNGKIYLVRK